VELVPIGGRSQSTSREFRAMPARLTVRAGAGIITRLTITRTAPVLFLVFNRPDLTRRVFQRIREARPGQLFIAADGPRRGHPTDAATCAETRLEVADVDWPCEVRHLLREENLGCKHAVSSAITWFFGHVDAGIILEDDCLPDPTFFRYCSELLQHYSEEPKVAMIGANQFHTKSTPPAGSPSYHFTKYPHIWGWATWRRTWLDYDVDLSGWTGDPASLAGIANPRVRRRFAKRFDEVKSGAKDTWDYQLVHQCIASGLLAINPAVNLVENIGFDGRATHTHARPENPQPVAWPMTFPLIHPPRLEADGAMDLRTETEVQGVAPNRWVSFLWSLRKRLRRLRQTPGS